MSTCVKQNNKGQKILYEEEEERFAKTITRKYCCVIFFISRFNLTIDNEKGFFPKKKNTRMKHKMSASKLIIIKIKVKQERSFTPLSYPSHLIIFHFMEI